MKLELTNNNYTGKLFTFCGLDGSGKSTYLKYVAELLEHGNNQYEITKQPTDAVRKSSIFRTYMDQQDHSEFDYRALSLLAASDRIQHNYRYIVPNLKNGKYILSDRYIFSCLANLRARGYSSDNWIYEISSHLVKPDIAFFFDVDVETAIKRVRKRPEEKERFIDIELQYKLRSEYLSIAEQVGGIVISTNQSFEYCINKIKYALRTYNVNV